MERNLPRGFYSKSGGISGIQGRLPRRWCRLGNGPSLYGIQTDLCFLTRQESRQNSGENKTNIGGEALLSATQEALCFHG